MAGLPGFKHLDRTNRDHGRERLEPVLPIEHAQGLRQRTQRGAFASLEIFDRVKSYAGSLGQLSLVEILSKPERPDLATKLGFPFLRSFHRTINIPKKGLCKGYRAIIDLKRIFDYTISTHINSPIKDFYIYKSVQYT